jgi:predicted acetyltransferase
MSRPRRSPAGSVTLEQPSAATRDACQTVFDAWRLGRPGEIRRREISWDYDLGLRTSAWGDDPKGFLAFHRAPDGTVDGYARYHAESRWEQRQPRNHLIVDELHGLDAAVQAALWRFLASMDWVSSLKASRRSPVDPLPWLLVNARAAALSEVGDGLWVRLGDLPAALEARRYATQDRIVIEAAEDVPGGSHRRVELDGGVDGATCRPTTKDPDLTLPAAALGAAYLGGPRLRDIVLGSGLDEHTPGALARADAMFRGDDPPWCSTFF